MSEEKEVIEVPVISSEGEFGIAVNNIEHMSVMGNLVCFWFNKEHMKPEYGWDFQVPFSSREEAEEALKDLEHIVRRMKMRLVK